MSTYTITDPDNIIVARKGAIHEKLTDVVKSILQQIASDTLKIDEKDPAYVAANILHHLLHSGDGRISDQSLTR
jgi:hypothetical protein